MKFASMIAGLVIALIGHSLALGLAGGGHGWNSPAFLSFVLWLAYPTVLIHFLALRDPSRATTDFAILFAALGTDAALVLMTLAEGMEYIARLVRVNGALTSTIWIGGWLLIWFGWQLIAVLNLLRARAARTA